MDIKRLVCSVALMCGLLPCIALAQLPPYDVAPTIERPYYRVRYEGSTEPGELVYPAMYTVWVPPGVDKLRGVVVHQHGCGEGSCKSGLTGAFDLHWQALAKKHACALVSPTYEQPEKADCQMWCDPRNGSAARFEQALADLGLQCGHPELAEVPWAIWGHSGGGHWAGGMVLIRPERVAAAWLRSGVPALIAIEGKPKPYTIPEQSLRVPVMCNLGTQEGVTVTDGRFSAVWGNVETFFEGFRSQGGLVGVAVDPLTSHECGNQRYLAIPWFDACLTTRLSDEPDSGLKAMPGDAAMLTPLRVGEEATVTPVSQADYKEPIEQSVWLPNKTIARAWMEYVSDTRVSDTTPPPRPTNVRVEGNRLSWDAEADLESGLAHFIIKRDGHELARVPEKDKNPFGRPIFQGLQYSDTPLQPLVEMQYVDTTAQAGAKHEYEVIAVNTVGLQSDEPAALRASRSISSEYAVQAAAADTKYIYSITNRGVAKHDRESGELIAKSEGEAEHLNSGFVWNGDVYCAHSNYPKTPERSQIMRLDTATMRLSTFKDFGDFGGSLTWVLRRGDHWWCNFAFYGSDNHRTALVEFDDDWNELGRWSYPRSVIDQLGRYSLSGGVWRGDELWVTGHDDPVIFRLRLAEGSNQLESVGRVHVPFTGQGIAEDPVTGGLVGIQRGKRLVVVASDQPVALQLKVMSYNIHHGEGIDGKLDLERIAKVILAEQPDVVALQEVDRRVTRSGQVDQPAELARMTNMHVVFGGNIELQGGEYGNAVLSRYPIVSHVNLLLPNIDKGEQRGVLEAEIELPDAYPKLVFMATHFDHRSDDRERVASAMFVNERISQASQVVRLLAGDLNDVSPSRTLAELAKHWRVTNSEPLATIPVDSPARQIDFVLVEQPEQWRVVETRVIDERVASDHRPIVAVLELRPE